MNRRIVIPHGAGRELARLFGCTQQTVCYALNFKKDSLLARRIRKAALERGGVDTGAVVKQLDIEN